MKRGDLVDPRKHFGEALLGVAERNLDVLALSADSSGGSGLDGFRTRFPERHLELGIMEQGVVGIAAGLASTGKVPFVVAIAPFVTSRPFEMVRNDLGYMRQNVKVVGRSGGLAYAELGATHHSLEDFALLRTIPGMVVFMPGDPVEITRAVQAAAAHVGPAYIRIGSPSIPVIYEREEDCTLAVGKGTVLLPGSDVTVIACGAALPKAHAAALALRAGGISARLVSMASLKPLDEELVLAAARETKRIVTVEEHYVSSGLGCAVASLLARHRPTPVCMLGVQDQFPAAGPYEDVLRDLGLQPDQIADAVRRFLG